MVEGKFLKAKQSKSVSVTVPKDVHTKLKALKELYSFSSVNAEIAAAVEEIVNKYELMFDSIDGADYHDIVKRIKEEEEHGRLQRKDDWRIRSWKR